MKKNKNLMIIKGSFLTKILNKIRNFFTRNNEDKKNTTEKSTRTYNYQLKDDNKKNEFLNSIKVQEDSGIIYLKIKLENNEIRAIDLTDEQIDELQKIYDKEILEKQNKIKHLKGIA